MKTFLYQMSGRAVSGLRILSILLILLYTSLQLNAQCIAADPAEGKISGFWTPDSPQSMAFGLRAPIRIINNVSGGSYVARTTAFGPFREMSSNTFIITSQINRMNLPDPKMRRDINHVKYWQESWYQPFINIQESNQKDTSGKYVPKKYWQIDWFNNVP